MRNIFLILVVLACFPGHAAFGGDGAASAASGSDESVAKEPLAEEPHALSADPSGTGFWEKAWGWTPRNAVMPGMWSIHLDGTGEYFGDGSNNDQQNLLGIQLFGFTAGVFTNSHNDPCWFFGPAREIYTQQLSENLRFDIGYKFGLLSGYGDDLPNINGMSAFAEAIFSFTWKRLGFDVGVLPTFIITGSFRIDIDFMD
ncbi:MAG: hypothetical protein LJE94_12525 [Deltaproteobacteria bacterium]|nr:hypothetical protein [Deltaproteobacteria bacterium]